LTGAIANLDFSKRKIQRERTMLSAINDVKVARVIPAGESQQPVKVYEKNGVYNGESQMLKRADIIEPRPADKRDPAEFAEMGGKGDQTLFDESDGDGDGDGDDDDKDAK
jgi:serine/threonine-protein kinase Chk2